jgi:hypothetical protein
LLVDAWKDRWMDEERRARVIVSVEGMLKKWAT